MKTNQLDRHGGKIEGGLRRAAACQRGKQSDHRTGGIRLQPAVGQCEHCRDPAGQRLRRIAAACVVQPHARLHFDEPAGGYFLWMGLPDGVRSAEVVAACETHAVAVSPVGRSGVRGPSRFLGTTQ